MVLGNLLFRSVHSYYYLLTYTSGSDIVLLALYVDDYRMASTSTSLLQRLSTLITTKFPSKQADISMYLGIHIRRENGTFFLNSSSSIKKMLCEFNMNDATGKRSPLALGSVIDGTGELDSTFPFLEAIGYLLWIARCSRPDIMYAVNRLGRYSKTPTITNIKHIKYVMRYLKHTQRNELIIKRPNNLTLVCFTDSDYAGEKMRATSGCIIEFEGSGPIFWSSKLQSTISSSTMESEYRAAAIAVRKIQALINLLREILPEYNNIPRILIDNQSALATIKSVILPERARHIQMDYHVVREVHQDGKMIFENIESKENKSDICTKILGPTEINRWSSRLFFHNLVFKEGNVEDTELPLNEEKENIESISY